MEITELASSICKLRGTENDETALVIGVSGIDASGKGYITSKLAEELTGKLNFAVINVDGWLNLPLVRFSDDKPGEHFYHHALRLDEMFDRLILPLKRARRLRLTADLARETAGEFHLHEYAFENIDIILLEGIFLFKRKYARHFDLKIWIECSFETALNRAIARSQEGLSPAETRLAYYKYYFPAQSIHLDIDDPKRAAEFVFANS